LTTSVALTDDAMNSASPPTVAANPCAVEQNFHRVRKLEAAYRGERRFEQPDVDDVTAVEREVVAHDGHRASERQIFGVDILRRVAADPVGLGGRADPDRRPRAHDLPRGGEIALQRGGRYAERVRLLSKPLLESSGGSSDEASTSSANRSRIAFAYSARLSQWRPAGRIGRQLPRGRACVPASRGAQTRPHQAAPATGGRRWRSLRDFSQIRIVGQLVEVECVEDQPGGLEPCCDR
jgi:hypothetical protein